jgi:elongation factor P
MNTETFEQVMLEEKLLDNPGLLKAEMMIEILFHAEKEIPLQIELPQYVNMEITYTEPGLKGDTATNTLKPATIETGMEVRVPLFVNQGDLIKIDTRDGSYVERVKK